MERVGQASASELKARGWTETMILRLLGSPCSAAPVQLYSLKKIVAARASMAFAAATKRAAVASRRALKMHQATAQALLQTAWAVPIALPDLPEQALRAAAEERPRGALAGRSPLPIGLEHLVAGHAVQILLERCEPSLYSLDEAFSASGVPLARTVVRKRTLAAIAASCVSLRHECARRFRAERGSACPSEDERVLELA